MSSDDNTLAILDYGGNVRLPVRKDPFQSCLFKVDEEVGGAGFKRWYSTVEERTGS